MTANGVKYLCVTIMASLALIALGGCASPRDGLSFRLQPAWIAVLFSKDAKSSTFIDSASREWISASAYFVYAKGERFTSTEELNEFLSARFEGEVQLQPPFPQVVSPGVFQLPLSTGGTAIVTITPTQLVLQSSDKDFIRALMEGIREGSKSPPKEKQPEDFSLTNALIGVFR